MLPLQPCESCHHLFQPSRRERRFCSKKCYGQANMHAGIRTKRTLRARMLRCHHCGQNFQSARYAAKYCSRTCQGQAASIRYKGAQGPLWKRVQRSCEHCNATFWAKLSTSRFCSLACRNSGMAAFLSSPGRPHPASTRIDVICQQCENVFEACPSACRKFCSLSCKYRWFSENRRGANHPQWKPTKNLRHTNKHTLRKRILARDQYCQECADTSHLQVHHKDGNHKNNDETNLVLLCKTCHAAYHVRRGENHLVHLILSNRSYHQPEQRPCAFCGIVFQPPYKRRMCCSLTCARALSSKRRKGQIAWNTGKHKQASDELVLF